MILQSNEQQRTKKRIDNVKKHGFDTVQEGEFTWSVDSKGIWYYGDDPEYSPCSIDQRKKDFYIQYYGCDIHCCSSLEKAKSFVIHYVNTPRNPEIAKIDAANPPKKYVQGGSRGNY